MRCFRLVLCLASALVACGDNLDGNHPPSAVDQTVTTPEDTPIEFTVDAADLEGGPLTITATTPAHGTLTVTDTMLSYRPTADYFGPDATTVTISDGTAELTVSVAITVTPVNDAPVAVDDSVAAAEDTGATITGAALVGNDTDVDGDALTVTAVGSASAGTVALDGDIITYIPPADFAGSATFEYTVTDGALTDTALVTVTVAGNNDAPVAVDDVVTTAENTAVVTAAAALLANDSDPEGQALSLTEVSAASNGTVTLSGGVVTFTPTASFTGTGGFDYTVSDGALTDTGHVTVTVTAVNDGPIAVDDTVTTVEDTAVTLTVAALVGNDADIDGDALTVTAVSAASNGTVSLDIGTITFTPAADFSGTAGFDYTVSDGALTDTGHVTVTVTPADDLPVAVDDSVSTNEDLAIFVDVLVNDTGLGDGGITIAASNGAHGTTIAGATNVRYVPQANYVGTDTFTYTITDADGDTSTATVTVTMNPVDDLPVAVNDSVSTNEDLAIFVDVLVNDTGLGDGGITIAASNGAHGTTIAGATNVLYVPQANYVGTDTFTYTITDADGDTSTATVTVTMNSVDDLPVAVNDSVTTNEDLGIFVDVLVNDTGLGDGGITLAASNGAHGTTIAGATNVLYVPQANYVGTDTFTYTITDADGDTSTATVTVTMNPVDDLPVAVDDSASTNEDLGVFVDVLVNDTGLGDGGITIAASNGAHGTTIAGATNVRYVPEANYVGTDTFTYTITDADGDTSTATVTVTVNSVDDLPVAVDDSASTNEALGVFVDVLVNDTGLGDGGITIAASNGAHGMTIAGATNVLYVPEANYVGTDTFTYTITDADGDTSTATVTVTMNSVDNLPVAVEDRVFTLQGLGIFVDVLANDTGLGDGGITIVASNGAHGTTIAGATNVLYLPQADYVGTDTFTYTITDADGDMSTATVTVTMSAP